MNDDYMERQSAIEDPTSDYDGMSAALSVLERDLDNANDTIAHQQAEIERLRGALEFYANIDNWFDTVTDMGWGKTWRETAAAEVDAGDIARAALEAPDATE